MSGTTQSKRDLIDGDVLGIPAADLGFVGSPPQHQVVAEALRRAIALARFAPGERLPPERNLSQILGVGRLTLRRAIRELDEQGYLETRRGRAGGSFVTGTGSTGTAGRRARREAIADIRETYEFRVATEPFAARLAAERSTATDRRLIRELAASDASTLLEYRFMDSRFHSAIALSCHNRYLKETILEARVRLFQWLDIAWMARETFSRATQDSSTQHQIIASAIEAGDGDSAARQMTNHLESSMKEFLARIEAKKSPTEAGVDK